MEVIKGRMYDYNNGRFLSVDPFIQEPSSTQSLNPYTYILNNPLSGVDPSGYRFVSFVANTIRLGSRYVNRALRKLKRSRSKERKPTSELPPDWGPNGDIPALPPLTQPSNPTGPSKTTSPAIEVFGSSTQSPATDQSAPSNTANDNGIVDQPIVMNRESDTSDTESESKPKEKSGAKRRAAREAQRQAGIPTSKPGENSQSNSGVDQPRHQIKEGADGEPAGVVDGRGDANNGEDHTPFHVEAGTLKNPTTNKSGTPRIQNNKGEKGQKVKVEYKDDIKK